MRALALRIVTLYAKTKRFPKLSEILQRHDVKLGKALADPASRTHTCARQWSMWVTADLQHCLVVNPDMRTARPYTTLYTLQTPRSTKHACCKRSLLLSRSGIDR